jgi:hypothetical protein
LPAHCCQPAVAGSVIYADLWGKLNTPLALQALFTQSSPVREPLLQAFPFPSTLAEVTLHPLSLACVLFTAHVGGGSSPLSCGVFLPLPLYKLSCSWLLGVHPCSPWSLPGQAQLVYLQFWKGFPSPPLWCSVCPTLFAMCLYCSYCLLLSFSFFSGWGLVCPGGYAVLAQGCLWEYCVPPSSPCPRLPKPSGCGCLPAPGGPPGFFI